MSSSIPYRDFKNYCEAHWSEFVVLKHLYKGNFKLQTNTLYKMYRFKFEKLKNCFKVLSLYIEAFGEHWKNWDSDVNEEAKRAIIYVLSMHAWDTTINVVREDLLYNAMAFPELYSKLIAHS